MQITIPNNCPCCNYTLETINEQLFCRNPLCDAQVFKKIEHFCKTIGIKGMGPKTLEKLSLNDITEIYFLDQKEVEIALGSARLAEKLFQEIELSKSAKLSVVLQSFSIPLIGSTASEKISGVVNHVSEITETKCKEAGLGDKATQNLMAWINSELAELQEFLPFSWTSASKQQAKEYLATVCITGKLKTFKTKALAQKALEEGGYKVVESVTKSLDYLVDEANDNSTKRQKADSYGITIISNLDKFLKKEI
jgi:NAD-dependent DNA ligase